MCRKPRAAAAGCAIVGVIGKEAAGAHALEAVEEDSAKERAEHMDGEKEILGCADPCVTVAGEPRR